MDLSAKAIVARRLNAIAQREFERDIQMVDASVERDNLQNGFTFKELLSMFYHLEMAISNVPKNIGEECYPYIPYAHNVFYVKLKEVAKEIARTKDWKDISFLEVGSGIGTKLYIAKNLVELHQVLGIEINTLYAEIAKTLVGENVLTMDATDYKNYDKHDIIYSYSPMFSTKQSALLKTIKENMKPGAVYLYPNFAESCISTFTT